MKTASKSPYWPVCWALALLCVVALVYAFERFWTIRGYWPTVMDSNDLWCQQRDLVVNAKPTAQIALVGASRIQFGLSPTVFRDEMSRFGRTVEPAMLAINGHYPLAALRDLARDQRFKGIAIVGVDSRGLQKIHREMQTKWINYCQHEWTPAKDVHRTLLTQLQHKLIAARPDFSWSTLLTRYLDAIGPPHREYVAFYPDRSGATDYSKSQLNAVREARIRDLQAYYASTAPVSATQWLSENGEVIEWVNMINARGGHVVFYREPVSGEHLALDEARFPRVDYWDALARQMPATMVDFRDDPALSFPTPDTSHIDASDIEAHTRALVRTLVRLGALERR